MSAAPDSPAVELAASLGFESFPLKPDPIRIYVACLAAYNNGHLHGVWIDAGRGEDYIWEQTRAMLKASPIPNAEEWAIHDYEGFQGAALYQTRVYDREINGTELSAFMRKLEPHLPCRMELALDVLGKDRESQARAQSHIWALLAGHEIKTDLRQQITSKTMIELGFDLSRRELFFEPGELWEHD